MASAAQSHVEVPHPPSQVSHELAALLQDLGYSLDEDFAPGGAELLFYAKRTVLYVKRAGAARIEPTAAGSDIKLGLDVAPGQPVGLLDGKRNRKLLEELENAIVVKLGRA